MLAGAGLGLALLLGAAAIAGAWLVRSPAPQPVAEPPRVGGLETDAGAARRSGIDIELIELTAEPEPVKVAAIEVPRRERRARPAPVRAEPPPAAPPDAPDDPAARAIALSAQGDREGCIRETRRHPRSLRLLTTRLGCAAGDTAETIATCREIRAHYPDSPYGRSCESILRAHGAL